MILAVTATSTYADSSNMQPALRGGAVVADFVQELAQLEDRHGCNPSTGYTWCARLQRCARSYECYPPAPKPSPKPDVCIPGIGLNWQCYPKGHGDGLPPCCNRYGNNHAGNCKNGNYNNAQIQCTAPGLCTAKFGNGCYKSSGMPKCCRGNGGSGCNYNSNLNCDASNGNILEYAFNNYLTDMNQYDEDIIDDDEEDEDTIIETYTEDEGPREGNVFVQELAQLEGSCAPDGGYSWCQSKNRCTRPWEEKCPADVCKTPEPKCYPSTGGFPACCNFRGDNCKNGNTLRYDTTCKPGPAPTPAPPTRVTCNAGGSEYNDPHSKELGMIASSFLVSQYVCGHSTGLAPTKKYDSSCRAHAIDWCQGTYAQAAGQQCPNKTGVSPELADLVQGKCAGLVSSWTQ